MLFQQRDELKHSVKIIDYVKYRLFIDESVEKLKIKWYNTHQRKFTSLRSNARRDAGLLDPDSVITNLSDYPLSEVEKLALANGLKFSLPPSKLKSGSYLASFELLFNNLSGCSFNGTDEDEVYLKETPSEIAYSSYFNFNMSHKSLLNIPREQHKALIGLSKNKEIIVTGPDKGSGVVIMNKSDYIKKMEEILGDSTKFKLSSGQDLYEVKVLDTCRGDLQLRYAESIHLKHRKQTLNTQERSIPLNVV